MYVFRKSRMSDIDAMEQIANEGKVLLKSLGINQWQRGTYPDRKLFEQDVRDGIGYVLTDVPEAEMKSEEKKTFPVPGEEVVAICAITYTPEDCYGKLLTGAWQTSEECGYATIHRGAVARKRQGQGLTTIFFQKAAELARANGSPALRADTHPENMAMQRSLEKAGFVRCCEMILTEGDEAGDLRLGYELKF